MASIVNKLTVFLIGAAIFAVSGGILFAVGPEPPEIAVYPDVYYPLDEILYLEGRSAPSSTVQITFTMQGAKPITLNSLSNVRGRWVLAQKIPLESGNWQVRARVVDVAGDSVSEWSNPRIIKVLITGVIVAGVTVKFVSLLFLLFSVLTASIILIFYFSFKAKRFQAGAQNMRFREFQQQLMEKTAALEDAVISKGRDAAEILCEKLLSELRRDIMMEAEHLKVHNPDIAKDEIRHWEQLLEEVGRIEQNIKQKIEEIHK